ncbi:hypothetical protein RFI_16209 [Reticulomyxa filosa]|uniref:Uncharacterized protein n=1 Tax=Reticulomyxa filosa TaxID=46433 RepID=X6N5H9_RETFI|nr:hypothetical protein RFI_16209 [Reticulomyxa filosa]|eukprot:ETO20994.1 hypothetical protein RFI_16209 [Reticulomyxa filosa]
MQISDVFNIYIKKEKDLMSYSEKEEVKRYFVENQIPQIFSRLTVLLLVNRPNDPKKYISEVLQDKSKDLLDPNTSLLDEEESVTLFSLLENPSFKGHVTGHQILSTFQPLGIRFESSTIQETSNYTLQQFKEFIANSLKY